ncbi:MAG: TerB family tellurite resistance protein [Parvibaculaceae bacterium]|nr:TerB family tellurite resistance protein [Parvibaculaceae bacterium]
MLNRIKAFLSSPTPGTGGFDEVQVAAVALLVRAATIDSDFSAADRATIRAIVERSFRLDEAEIARLIAIAEGEEAETLDLFRWAQAIKQHMSENERVGLIEEMWEVVYADGHVDDFEANLLRRVAGLIYVPDVLSGAARQRVLARRGNSKENGSKALD